MATQRREAEALLAAGEHRAAAALLAKLLRQVAGDGDFKLLAELDRLLAEAGLDEGLRSFSLPHSRSYGEIV